MPTLNNNLVDKNGIPSPELVQIFNNIETKGNTYEDKLLDWISEHSYKYINKTKNEQV
jgi:hypothetical protein